MWKNSGKSVQFSIFFWFGGILGSASRAEFPASLSNHVGFTPRLLYSSTHQSSESFIHLKTGWAQDAWLQWLYENWYFHLDISRWRAVWHGCYQSNERWKCAHDAVEIWAQNRGFRIIFSLQHMYMCGKSCIRLGIVYTHINQLHFSITCIGLICLILNHFVKLEKHDSTKTKIMKSLSISMCCLSQLQIICHSELVNQVLKQWASYRHYSVCIKKFHLRISYHYNRIKMEIGSQVWGIALE